MINYIVQVVLFQVLFLAVYDFFLKKETFHSYNRWYLLGTPIVSFVLPLIQIPTIQKAVPQEFIVMLPEIMLSPQKAIAQTAFYTDASINTISLLFWIGVAFFTLLFLFKIFKIVQLIITNETIKKHFYKLVLLPKTHHAFSFFNYIFLGKNIPKEKQETIIKHELIHSKQKHSFDLLFFEFLRIAMWFNPMMYVYQQRIALLHEYISDAEVVKTIEKHDYFNKLLSQTFQVENISFVNQFYTHSFIKKRIIMMTKNKSKEIRKVKYILLLPLLASMLIYTSCNVEDSANVQNQEVEKLNQTIKDLKIKNERQHKWITDLETEFDLVERYSTLEGRSPFTVIEEVPIFPGCTGTRAEKVKCLNESVKKHIRFNFNADLASSLGLSSGKNKFWVTFRIDKKGNITGIKARAPHPKLKEEAIRVVKTIPKMIPGKHKGKSVGMKYTVPISFNVD